jgi:hypothetical protein
MNIRERLARISEVIVDEAKRNSAFRRRLEEAINGQEGLLTASESNDQHDNSSRRGGRRTPAVIDPLGLARKGEDVLRKELSSLSIEQLKDVVAQYGMDPGKLVMKWKDSMRIIDRIVELSLARSTKGDAFRADKPPAIDTPPE